MEIANCAFFCYFVLLLGALHFRPSLTCGSRNGYDRRGPRKPLMLQQSIPDTTEFSQQASGPANGKITRNSPEFEKLEPCYNNGIIFRDEEGTGADRLMSKVGVLSFVYILYLTFHHFKCTACNFLWGLCTLDRSACGARFSFIHRFTTTIVKKLRELFSCCRFFSLAMQREIDNVGGFSERTMAFLKTRGDRGLGRTRPTLGKFAALWRASRRPTFVRPGQNENRSFGTTCFRGWLWLGFLRKQITHTRFCPRR